MAGSATASRRPLVLTGCAVLLTTAVLLPASRLQLDASASFLPAMLAVVAGFDLISVYLLTGDYRDRGDPRLLIMAWAYAWSLAVMAGYALAFPGAVAVDPPLAATPSTAPYLYIAWHGGFPLLLGAAWAPWPARWLAPGPVGRRRIVSVLSITVAALLGAGVVVLITSLGHRLPVLIHGLNTWAMTTVTAPVTLPLVALALAAAVHGTRRRTGPERWTTVAILVCLCDLLLTYFSGTRYSLGWYSGRSLTPLSAAIVLLAMLAAFRRLKAEAEHDAATDALTGLANRRHAFAAFEQLIARCRRSGADLGVICLDLDLFKQVNDRHGHETGDRVLVETARLLTRSCRLGDVVARVGGEEFLLLLPDTDERGTLVVAERVRAVIAELSTPALSVPVTASLGATALRADDAGATAVLRRADIALYQAKASGRNHVVLAAAPAAALG